MSDPRVESMVPHHAGLEPVPDSWHETGPSWYRPRMTKWRVVCALIVALIADGLQLLFGPLGWILPDEVIDVGAMVLTMGTIGFHVLLLPTFVLEWLPVADLLPTWTGCVLAVVALRRHEERRAQPRERNQ